MLIILLSFLKVGLFVFILMIDFSTLKIENFKPPFLPPQSSDFKNFPSPTLPYPNRFH